MRIRKISIGVLVLFAILLVHASSAFAATIPAKNGYVQDTADILSKDDEAEIVKRNGTAPFHLYVYTINSLNGKTSGSVASSVFKSWSLGKDDGLLLVSMDEREARLELSTGSDLQSSILESPDYKDNANPVSGLLDDVFIPSAADGEFGSGTLSLMSRMSELEQTYTAGNKNGTALSQAAATTTPATAVPATPATAAPAATAPSTSAPSSAAPASAERSSVAPATTAPSSAASSNSAATAKRVGNIIGTIVVVFLLNLALGILLSPLALIFYLRKNKRNLTKEFLVISKQHQENLSGLYQIEQEIGPLLKMSDGTSEAFLTEVESKYNRLLQMATADSPVILNDKARNFIFGKKAKSYLEAKRRVLVIAKEVQDVRNALERYRDLEADVTVGLKSLHKDWDETNEMLARLIRETGNEFEELVRKGQALKERLGQSQGALAFDPLEAQKFSDTMQQQIGKWKQDVASLFALKEKWDELPKLLRQEIQQLAEQEGLILSEANPYELLDAAESRIQQFARFIEKADIKKGDALASELEQDRATALAIVKDTIAARDWVGSMLASAKDRISRQKICMPSWKSAWMK
ncbi:TPM domain-containing protein [Paenibacillus caui]|uniref:TPM domain-containing protein n=1 Tax=Paenibacillus caui TaxID=2873927 RepID=UPI001CA885EE|nr:TPM domain-containing protein [Paenibacillus caui]